MIVYGRKAALMELDARPEGTAEEQAHQQAIATQQRIEQEQNHSDHLTFPLYPISTDKFDYAYLLIIQALLNRSDRNWIFCVSLKKYL